MNKRFGIAALVAVLGACVSARADYFPGEVESPRGAFDYCLHVGPLNKTCVMEGELSTSGHITSRLHTSPAPTVASCGTNPSVLTGSTDDAGQILTGSSAVTACTLVFGTPFAGLPLCTFTDANGSTTPVAYSAGVVTSSSVVIDFASATSKKINYICLGTSQPTPTPTATATPTPTNTPTATPTP